MLNVKSRTDKQTRAVNAQASRINGATEAGEKPWTLGYREIITKWACSEGEEPLIESSLSYLHDVVFACLRLSCKSRLKSAPFTKI